MTISLLNVTKYHDDLFAARWLDDEFNLHFEFNALHDATGKPLAANREGKAPTLTADQLASAEPFTEPQHPAYALAAKGTAARPDWVNRYQKAAELVEAGHVRLTGPETAVVSSSQEYTVSDKCHCKWMTFSNDGPCSHIIAARMARALNQPIQPLTEAEKEVRGAARRRANRDATQLRIASRGENKYERARRAQVGTGEDARRYALAAVANGGTVPADIWVQAHGGLVAQLGQGGD